MYKVITSELKTSKKGNQYNKVAIALDNAIGFAITSVDVKKGDSVNIVPYVDYNNNISVKVVSAND